MAATKPKNRPDHVWHTARRAGVVTVERSPTFETREQREARYGAVVRALDGASAAVVAERYGMSRSAVLGLAYRYRQARGLASTNVTSFSTARAERHQAVLEALQTRTVDEVAARLGISVRSVRDIRLTARAAGAHPETPRAPSTIDRVTILTSRAAPALPVIEPVAPTPIAVIPAFACSSVPRVSLLEAAHGQCRALGDDGLCCSAPVVHGRSWCPEHLRAFTQPAWRSA